MSRTIFERAGERFGQAAAAAGRKLHNGRIRFITVVPQHGKPRGHARPVTVHHLSGLQGERHGVL